MKQGPGLREAVEALTLQANAGRSGGVPGDRSSSKWMGDRLAVVALRAPVGRHP
jgi:hypothetical protein